MKNLPKTLSVIAGAFMMVAAVLPMADEPAQAEDGSTFLDDLAAAGQYKKSCTQDGINGVVFSDTLEGERFIPYSDVLRFLEDSYGNPDYESANREFRKAKDDFRHVLTVNRMNGRNIPDCGL